MSVVCVIKVTSCESPSAFITTNSFNCTNKRVGRNVSPTKFKRVCHDKFRWQLTKLTLRNMRLPSNSMTLMPDLVVIYQLVEI